MSSHSKAVTKYIKNNYDEIKIRVPKGDKERFKEHAEICKESLNAFIKRAIEEAIERDERK